MSKRLILYIGVACLAAFVLQPIIQKQAFLDVLPTINAFFAGTALLTPGCFIVYYIQVKDLKMVKSFREAGYMLEHMVDSVLLLSLGWTLAFITAPTLTVILDILALFFIHSVWREIVWFNEQESKKEEHIVHE
jgi:hypothetical protein